MTREIEQSEGHVSMEAVLAVMLEAVAVGDGLEMPSLEVTPSVQTDTVSKGFLVKIAPDYNYPCPRQVP